jgi:hypothetical protein
MKRNLKRLIIALIISASGFAFTQIWFTSSNKTRHMADQKPVAHLSETTNDVKRKPQRRVIWESVSKNDDLYPGEAIRTSANGEAKIKLVKSGAVIHLDPDSLVVLEESGNGLALDFLQGNLFVQSSEAGATDGLTLKTGKGEIKLKSADMSLSRDQAGQVSLEVYKGQAELQQGAQKLSLEKDKSASLGEGGMTIAKDRVQILYPQAGESILLNLTKGEKLDVSFKPLPAGYNVTAEWGHKRQSLKPAGSSVAGDAGKITVNGKSGKWFLRLVAQSSDPALPPLNSIIVPLHIDPKSPPALIEPTAETPVIKANKEAAVTFRWLNRHRLQSQILEVAADPLFKNVKVKQTLRGEDDNFESALPDGTYWWRVTGFLKIKDKVEPLMSPVIKFTAQSTFEIKPPALVWPADQQKLSYSETQKSGVTFKWQAPTGLNTFHALVEKKTKDGWKPVIDRDFETLTTKLTDPSSGTYQWKVATLDPKGGESKTSPTFTFVIEEMPKIEWVEQPDIYEYPTPTPTLHAQWKPMASAASYRYRIAAKNNSNEPSWEPTKQNLFEANVPAEGEYEATVEALNSKGQTIAQSAPKTFTVKRRPLLPAPQWAENTPESLKADPKGNLSFGWEQVDGANHYLMILESEDGKVVDKKEVKRTTASLTRLKPGQYKVKLMTVDTLQRPSEQASTKDLYVPTLSDIKAPKIKNMKVK